MNGVTVVRLAGARIAATALVSSQRQDRRTLICTPPVRLLRAGQYSFG